MSDTSLNFSARGANPSLFLDSSLYEFKRVCYHATPDPYWLIKSDIWSRMVPELDGLMWELVNLPMSVKSLMNGSIVAQTCDGSTVLCQPVPQEEASQRERRHREFLLEVQQRGIMMSGCRPVFKDTGEVI